MDPANQKKSRWKKIDERFVYLNNILLKIGLWFLIITGLVMLWAEFRQDQFLISTIEVPLSFEEQGIKPNVAAQRIFDEIANFQNRVSSVREASGFSTSQHAKNVDFQVAGFGLSLQTLAAHLRSAVGKSDQTIRGEIIEGVDSVSLRMRLGGATIAQLQEKLHPNREVTMNALALQVAEILFSKTEPYLYAVHISNTKTAAESLPLAKQLLANPEEKKWAFNLIGNIYAREERYQKAIEYYKKAEKEDPNFLLAKRNLGYTYREIDSIDLAINYFQKAIVAAPKDQQIDWLKSEKYYLLKSNYPDDPRIAPLEKEFSSYTKNDQFLSILAANLINNGDIEAAKHWAQKSYSINPENSTALSIKLMLACAMEDSTNCKSLIAESKELNPNSMDVTIAQAIQAISAKDLEQLNYYVDLISLDKTMQDRIDLKNILAVQAILQKDSLKAKTIIDSYIQDFKTKDIEVLKKLTYLSPIFPLLP